jgi:hypothetical protein
MSLCKASDHKGIRDRYGSTLTQSLDGGNCPQSRLYHVISGGRAQAPDVGKAKWESEPISPL